MSTLNVATAKVQNYQNQNGVPVTPALAWVNFNGKGTVSIRASNNVSSITDNGVGDYTVNFTNAMQDSNYAVALGGGEEAATVSGGGNVFWGSHYNKTPSSYRFVCAYWGGGSLTRVASDFDQVTAAFFR